MEIRIGKMTRFKHDILLRLVKGLNALLITGMFALSWYMFYSHYVRASYGWKGQIAVVLVFMCIYVYLGKIYRAFLIQYKRISEIVYGQFIACVVTDIIFYLFICLLEEGIANPLPGLLTIAGQFLCIAVWAFNVHKWYFAVFPALPTAVVYDSRGGIEELVNEYEMNKKFDIQKVMHVDECLQDLTKLDGMHAVFLSGIHSHERNIILKYCIAIGIKVMVIPRLGDVIMSGAWDVNMFHLPMLTVDRYGAKPEFLLIKRISDIVLSLIAIILLSPTFLITSIAIKAYDGGSVLYKQVRLTKNAKEFEILKFRSMRVDSEKDGVARLSTGVNDDRITPVGRIIRKCRIDELPQLFNILKGDMSIVGPRPERPEIAAQYCKQIPEFQLRLQAKAGLTGYAQVFGKYNSTPYDKLQMDLMYIAHPGLAKDLEIMLATVKILFMPESTEGISEGQTTAMGQDTENE